MARNVKVVAPKKRKSKQVVPPAPPRIGRPAKAVEDKSRAITVTLSPAEYALLETLRGKVGPVPLIRSDVVRLGVTLAGRLTVKQLCAELAKIKG